MDNISNIELKAQLLSNGINITEEARRNFCEPYLIKRRAYGNSDENKFITYDVPQELILLPDELVVGVTLREQSSWTLDFAEGKFFVKNSNFQNTYVDFTKKPDFYDIDLSNGKKVSSVVTLISRNTLGMFVNTTCTFAKHEFQCKYCSINKNLARPNDLENIIDKDIASEAVKKALDSDLSLINSILISGGNFDDFDKNFLYYTDLAMAIQNVVNKYSKKIEVVLGVFPPKNLTLIERLKNQDLNILISTEVFDQDLFKKYCPGKSDIVGKEHIISALDKLIDVLGKNKVFSIVIHGLESDESLIKGMEFYSSKGVCPIVNVLHIDPNTYLQDMQYVQVPSANSLIKIGEITQKIYSKNDFNTLNIYSGRNAFDREASLKLFSI